MISEYLMIQNWLKLEKKRDVKKICKETLLEIKYDESFFFGKFSENHKQYFVQLFILRQIIRKKKSFENNQKKSWASNCEQYTLGTIVRFLNKKHNENSETNKK